MSVNLWKASTINAFSTTLNGSIAAGDTSITLTSVTGLQAPGILCIDRVDTNNTNTPTSREYISFTGISTNTLTGVTRGVAGSTAQAHSSGAIVEENFSITHWGDILDFLAVSHDSSGNIVVSSTATVSIARIYTHLNASGASITGINALNPTWVISAAASSVTAFASYPLAMPTSGTFSWFSVTLNGAASGANLILDIKKNGTSIFDTNTRPTVTGGGTFASTASILTKGFNQGDTFWVDIAGMGGTPVLITAQGKAS